MTRMLRTTSLSSRVKRVATYLAAVTRERGSCINALSIQ